MDRREKVWLEAWCAVASAWNCKESIAAAIWADKCLKAFDERFPAPKPAHTPYGRRGK